MYEVKQLGGGKGKGQAARSDGDERRELKEKLSGRAY